MYSSLWYWYFENHENEIISITPVHTWINNKIILEKWPQFNSEDDCQERANEPIKYKENRTCYNVDPNDWMWFYMWDSEPRPIFKTYEECEDWAISMMPYSLIKNAKWWIHAWDWDTRCSQWCHYSYKVLNYYTRVFSCNKTIHSVRWRSDKFEKIMDKLDEWWDYYRFVDAFWNDKIWCDIIINDNGTTNYSYLNWIWHEIGISRADVVTHKNDKIITKQKNVKNWKVFYVQQMSWLLYVRWDTDKEKWIWKIYKIKNSDDNIVFQSIKELFDNDNIEITCHNDFGWSTNDLKKMYTLPENIERTNEWVIDNIFYRIYQDNI